MQVTLRELPINKINVLVVGGAGNKILATVHSRLQILKDKY